MPLFFRQKLLDIEELRTEIIRVGQLEPEARQHGVEHILITADAGVSAQPRSESERLLLDIRGPRNARSR